MRTARLLHGIAVALWWAPTLVMIVVGCLAEEAQAHLRIARASRLYGRAERFAEAGQLDRAQTLIDRGDRLIELAKPQQWEPK